MSSKAKTLLGWALLIGFFAMSVMGIERGEMALVIQKSISICLECIGIG